MKIMAREFEKAEKAPFSASVLQLIGVSQFLSASWMIFALTGALRQQLGSGGVALGVFLAVDLGLGASIISFAAARLLTDLHAIRWNTDGYTVQHEKDDLRLLGKAMDRLSYNIERALSQPAAPSQPVPRPVSRPASHPSADSDDFDPDHDPYDFSE